MAAGTSVDVESASAGGPRYLSHMRPDTQRYGTIIIVGGGCYGSYYVRQLQRASSAGALTYERLAVVDRDPACRVARGLESADGSEGSGLPRPEVVVREWQEFFRDYFLHAMRQ